MGGCSSSKEELRQIQKKVALRGDPSIIKEFGNFMRLQKGGILVPTELGMIQFGLPPETVKDNLSKRQDIPFIYILPSTRFDISGGTTLMDMEAVITYNHFMKNRKTTFLTDEDGQKALKDIFQEGFLGPADLDNVKDDFPMQLHDKMPDFKREQACFTWNSETKKQLQFEDCIQVLLFDQKGEIFLENKASGASRAKVIVIRHRDHFEVVQNGTQVATFKDEVSVLKRSYLCYKIIEEDRFELVEGIRFPAEDTYIEEEPKIAFDPPDFGLTFLGAGDSFDYEDANPGFVIWINQRGILVNPPAFSTDALHKIGVPPTMIDKIILTSAKADYDAGVLQKILSSPAIEIITTKTIMASFVRKYAAIIGISCDDLRRLFQFRPVTISHPLILYGATFEFKYTFNAIPSLGFQIEHGGSSLYFSGENLYSPTRYKELLASGIFSKDRYKELAEVEWGQFTYILHNAGGEPNYTSLETLQSLPAEVQNKTLVFQISSRRVPEADEESEQSGIQKVKSGLSHTLTIIRDLNKDSLMRNLEIVSGIDFFEKIPLKRICDLIRCVKEVKYKLGDFVIREGTKGSKFFVIKRGVCKIYSRKPGREFSKFVYPGDHFGESAVMGDGIRMANVITETDCILLEINKHDFAWCLGAQLDSGAVGLMKNLSAIRHSGYAEFINKNHFISKLTELQKTDLNMRIEVVKVEPGETLWLKNSTCEFAAFICGGAFELETPEDLLGKLKLNTGHLVCDFPSVMNEKVKTVSSVKCVKQGDILKIKKNLLLDFLANNPGLYISLRDKIVVE